MTSRLIPCTPALIIKIVLFIPCYIKTSHLLQVFVRLELHFIGAKMLERFNFNLSFSRLVTNSSYLRV